MRNFCCIVLLLLLPARLPAADGKGPAADLVPPPPAREFRAAWITTVGNIDWPSKPGLSVAQQKAEMVALLDRAAQLHFNAVFFQVRPVSDALYFSTLEPWSEYLTGVQGRGTQPLYDPLAFALAEAHQRGLELHAWFNPFRAAHPDAKSPPAVNHITKVHPELIRRVGTQTILDPGEPESQRHVLEVMLDVVKRYDVDGVVIDDYFYPYPQKDWAGHELDFPDQASWKKYGVKSGLSRADWRRDNVNRFIQKLSQGIKAGKPRMQFGVAPFGIWRPLNPLPIRGMDAYDKIFADSRKWLASGWVDYFAPQLYWPVASREQSFPLLLGWWRAQNVKGRHLWPGLYDAKLPTDEIARQIQAVRAQCVADAGTVHYHLRSVLENPALAAAVKAQYAQPALVPPSPWIDAVPPERPKVSITATKNSVTIRWENGGAEPARWWLLQTCVGTVWTTAVLPASQGGRILNSGNVAAISVRAVDRLGNLSAPALWPPKPVVKEPKVVPAPAGAGGVKPKETLPAPPAVGALLTNAPSSGTN